MKKMNNKGFSLVELIIVIAIMAILVGVMAPSLMKYIEKSRYSADAQIVDSAYSALKYAMANEAAYKEVAAKTQDGDQSMTLEALLAASDLDTLATEVKETFGSDTYEFGSKAFLGQKINVKMLKSGEFIVSVTSTDDTKWPNIVLPKSEASNASF